MSYLDIDNLYKNQDILLFRRCYAMEKIHGTSSHISWNSQSQSINLFSGGSKYELFEKLFDINSLTKWFIDNATDDIVVFGEAYGGSMQGMRATYGDKLKFIVFEVKIGNCWLSVPKAQQIAFNLGLEFVHYIEINADVDSVNFQRDLPSVQAMRNGCGDDKKREGIVLRPLIEFRKNNGERIIAKHKALEFQETKRSRDDVLKNQENMEVLVKAQAIADEWVTLMRLKHVLDQFPEHTIQITGKVIESMIVDIEKESVGEVVMSSNARKCISKSTALMYKQYLNSCLCKKEI